MYGIIEEIRHRNRLCAMAPMLRIHKEITIRHSSHLMLSRAEQQPLQLYPVLAARTSCKAPDRSSSSAGLRTGGYSFPPRVAHLIVTGCRYGSSCPKDPPIHWN
jgi:hypothetical protein